MRQDGMHKGQRGRREELLSKLWLIGGKLNIELGSHWRQWAMFADKIFRIFHEAENSCNYRGAVSVRI